MSLSLPRGYLSISQIEMYQRCPRQYEFRYVREMVCPPGMALAFGKAAHSACQHTHQAIATTSFPASDERVQAVFADSFDAHLDECVITFEDKPDAAKDMGVSLVMLYNRCIAPDVWPLRTKDDGQPWIEREVKCDVAGVPMLGIIDLIDAAAMDDECIATICDIKTVSKTKSQSEADNSLQLTFYSLATGVEYVRFDQMIKTKKPKLERTRSMRDKEDYAWLEQVVASVARAITMGAFPPCSTDSWCCSPKWCGYWQHCRGARR